MRFQTAFACIALVVLASCAGSAPGTLEQQPLEATAGPVAPVGGLPALPRDDAPLHTTLAAEMHTFVAPDEYSGMDNQWLGDLIHLPAEGLSYNIVGVNVGDYRPLSLALNGSCDGLWVGLPDYATGKWHWLSPPSASGASYNLPLDLQFISPGGNAYVAFLAPAGVSATFAASMDTEPEPDPTQGSWNVLVWIAGDNNLADFGVEDLEEMEAIGSTEDIRLLAGYDINPDWLSTPTAGVDEVHFIKVVQDSVAFSIKTDGDPANQSFPRSGYNSADPAKLREFVDWASTNFPAEHTMLVLWDHGSGWRLGDEGSERQGSSAAGPSRSESAGIERAPFHGSRYHPRSLGPLQRGKTAERSGSGVLGDDSEGSWTLTGNDKIVEALDGLHFDIIAFDACNMGQMESLYEYSDLCDWQLASQVLVPGSGYPYDQALVKWTALFPAAPEVIGQCFVESVIENYSLSGEYVTHSVYNCDELKAATAQLAQFAATVTANAETESENVIAAIEASFEPEAGDGTRDLKGFMQDYLGRTSNTAIQDDINALLPAFDSALFYFAQFDQPLTSGAGIFLPDEWYFDIGIREEYRQLAFNDATKWLEMLEATGVPGSGGGGGLEADWVPGDKLVVDWMDPLGDVDMYIFDPDGEYGSPFSGDTANLQFSEDSALSGAPQEWAVLKEGASFGTYYLDLSYVFYDDFIELPVIASVMLYDSEGALKQDLGTYPLLFPGDFSAGIVELSYQEVAP